MPMAVASELIKKGDESVWALRASGPVNVAQEEERRSKSL